MAIDERDMQIQPVDGLQPQRHAGGVILPELVGDGHAGEAVGASRGVLFELHVIQMQRHLVGERQQQVPSPHVAVQDASRHAAAWHRAGIPPRRMRLPIGSCGMRKSTYSHLVSMFPPMSVLRSKLKAAPSGLRPQTASSSKPNTARRSSLAMMLKYMRPRVRPMVC